jgi:hypothetical protein
VSSAGGKSEYVKQRSRRLRRPPGGGVIQISATARDAMNTLAFRRPCTVAEIRPSGPSPDEVLARRLFEGVHSPGPFRHLRLRKLLPTRTLVAVGALPYPPPPYQTGGRPRDGVRRTHALWRRAPDAALVCQTLARDLASPRVADQIFRRMEVDVAGCAVRLSLSQEVDGYACEPQTGQGEARFRIVVALPPSHQSDLGPDLYTDPETWAAQLPWTPGAAFAFAPAADTWHGFEPRLIRRLRASLVIDYVTG